MSANTQHPIQRMLMASSNSKTCFIQPKHSTFVWLMTRIQRRFYIFLLNNGDCNCRTLYVDGFESNLSILCLFFRLLVFMVVFKILNYNLVYDKFWNVVSWKQRKQLALGYLHQELIQVLLNMLVMHFLCDREVVRILLSLVLHHGVLFKDVNHWKERMFVSFVRRDEKHMEHLIFFPVF